jgi:hypothetical protein
LQDSGPAAKIFDEHYTFLQRCFEAFWEELRSFAFDKMQQLLSDHLA